MLLHGSTIVLVKSAREIVAAADSKVISFDDTGETHVGNVCKINQIGKYFFTNSGYHGCVDTGINVVDIAREAANSTTTLEDCHFLFRRLLFPHLYEAVLESKKTAKLIYEQRILDQSVINGAFFALNNHELVVLEFWAVVEANTSQRDGFQIRFEGNPNIEVEGSDILHWVFGSQGAVEEYLATNPNVWRMGIVSAAKKLIELEIEHTPSLVGPPIAILRIDKAGAKWIQRTPHCKSIRK